MKKKAMRGGTIKAKPMVAKPVTKVMLKKELSTKKKPGSVVSPKQSIKNKVAASRELKRGDLAPDFSLESTSGGLVSLSLLRGKRVVLYFYPKDLTSGCTIEAHEFTALAKKFAAKGTILYGVSPDSIESHKKFIGNDRITYPLLADVGHKVAEAYGVWIEKSMYGKKYMGIDRSTFVIGPDGTLEQVYHKVKPEGHALCVLEEMSEIKKK
jgi:peroxiredoxin Q/BCP